MVTEIKMLVSELKVKSEDILNSIEIKENELKKKKKLVDKCKEVIPIDEEKENELIYELNLVKMNKAYLKQVYKYLSKIELMDYDIF